ncbi:MAG: SMC-Scp complex subunit ScpB [Anaerolineaceae bacterium]|nr:SMC-Scp complex subunit ScpB [Anaerolineaceae bacterium]
MTEIANNQAEIMDNLKKLEALLFAASGLSSAEQLAQGLKLDKAQVTSLLDLLSANYQLNSGLRLQKVKNQYQLVTAPEYAEDIEHFLGLEVTTRLTQASLEALAIIAYKQPATRPEIDAIRGVNSDGVVKSLLTKGLIEELGRSEAAGRPILYGVTEEFLHHFGLESTEQLPPVDLQGIVHMHSEAERNTEVQEEKELNQDG